MNDHNPKWCWQLKEQRKVKEEEEEDNRGYRLIYGRMSVHLGFVVYQSIDIFVLALSAGR